MRPDAVVENEIQKVKDVYKDVIEETKDISQTYKAVIPEIVKKNNLNQKPADYVNFRNVHISQKKKLELEVFKQNKKQELNNEIFALMEPKRRQKQMKQRNEKLRKSVIKSKQSSPDKF